MPKQKSAKLNQTNYSKNTSVAKKTRESSKEQSKNEELIEYRQKFLDIEHHAIKIESINKLLTTYADEYSPEASIIASLINKEIEEIFNTLV